jgi:hypothetical protein
MGARTTGRARWLTLTFALACCHGTPDRVPPGSDGVEPAGEVHELSVVERSNAYPSVEALGSFVAVAWGATTAQGVTDIYVALSRDAGDTFGTPVRVSDAGSQAKLSGEQPPELAFVPRGGLDPSVVVVWTSAGAVGTRLVSARSNDGARTFSRPTVVAGSDAPGNRGWQSIATEHDGSVVAMWLDHRDTARANTGQAGHTKHEHGASGTAADSAARAQLSKLFFGRLGDAGSARPVTGGVCYCCKTAVAVGADGTIYSAWRHVYAGNHRDIAFSMSSNGGRTFSAPIRVSEDGWQLDGCPENGPSIAADGSSRIHLVWPTLVRESGREMLALFYASSPDGRTFTRRVRIPAPGPAYHPRLTRTANNELLVAWDEFTGGQRRLRAVRGRPSATGDITFSAVPLGNGVHGTYPVVAATARGVFAAWTTPGSRIATVRIPLS